jgi:hypothetical protein
MALMFIPAPTDVNTTISPLFILWGLSSPFIIKSKSVGTVATDELPNHEIVMGITSAGESGKS